MNINNPTTFATPSLTLSTSNSSGTSGALRADDTILVYDTTSVDSIAFGQSGSVGSASTASRRDHSHAMATPTFQTGADQSAMESGSSTTAAVSPGVEIYSPGTVKSWVYFDGTGTPSARRSHKFSSITDNGTGNYTITWSQTLLSYHVFVSGSSARTTSDDVVNQTTTSSSFGCYNDDNNLVDVTHAYCMVVGTLA